MNGGYQVEPGRSMFLQVCPVCEHRNPRGSRFCNDCGSPLQLRFCPSCHAAEDVMSLVCRECGARLPMLAVTDAPAAPQSIAIPGAPEPAPFEPTLGGARFDLATAPPAPPEDDDELTIPAALTEETSPTWPEPEPALSPFRTAAADPGGKAPTADTVAPDPADAPAAGGASIIEQLSATPQRFAFMAGGASQVSEGDQKAVAADAGPPIETAGNAAPDTSAVPIVTAGPDDEGTPVGIVVDAQPAPTASGPLLPGAWAHALGADNARLAPALIRADAPPRRRLALGRVGLALGLAGALAASAIYLRFSPPGSSPIPSATTEPAQRPAEATAAAPANAAAESAPAEPPTASNAAAAAAALAASATSPATAATSAAPAIAPADTPSGSPSTEAPAGTQDAASAAPPATHRQPMPDATAGTAPAAKPATAGASPARAPAAANPVPATHRGAVEAPQVCTPAIAALGLCTTPPPQEGN